jgi:endogenous inhibitor of DNA gyrase (YacG/DUF329 family)
MSAPATTRSGIEHDALTDDYFESLITARCVTCGEEVTAEPDNPEPWCLECVLFDIRTPEEYAMTLTMPLEQWDAYRANRAIWEPRGPAGGDAGEGGAGA